jgi:hypothetical protein
MVARKQRQEERKFLETRFNLQRQKPSDSLPPTSPTSYGPLAMNELRSGLIHSKVSTFRIQPYFNSATNWAIGIFYIHTIRGYGSYLIEMLSLTGPSRSSWPSR